MSAITVHNAILDISQKNSALDNEFSSALTGTASSNSTIVTGVGTSFTTELQIDDYIGKPSKGYRRVMKINSATELEVESAFDSNLSSESVKKTEIKKGFADNESLTKSGRLLRITLIGSSDLDVEASRKLGLSVGHSRVWAVYGFLFIMAFYEPNSINADERKGSYDKMLRDVIDNNMTINGICIGITEMGKMMIQEHPDTKGIYYGVMPITCFRSETLGNR